MSRKTVTSSHRIGLLALAAGVFAFVHAAIAADPIKIGVTIAQSPPGSVIQGTQVLDALQVTQKIINDAGGVLGRPIELVVEDTQGLPEKLSLIHISEPTRRTPISYAVFCLKKK